MSAENGKVCCNCRHNIRMKDNEGKLIHCYCEVQDMNMAYVWVMEGWCRHWASDEKKWKERKNEFGEICSNI